MTSTAEHEVGANQTVCKALRKAKAVMTASGLVQNLNRRRMSAIGGIGYNILVAIDGTKESWKALDAVLYFVDSQRDILSTLTIKDNTTPKDIESQIKKV